MVSVETVRGPVELGDLGQTLMHEHVFVLSTEHVQNYGSGWWDEEARVADAIAKLNSLYAKGIRTIVDPTVWGLGRNIPRIQRIAAQTEVNIIVAAGLYVYEELPQQYAYRGPGLTIDIPEPMVTDFATDITEGIAGTGVKAALIKTATDRAGVTPNIERILRAVARAHRATGAPITTHTTAAIRNGLDQQRIFAEEGVDLRRVVIGHSGDSTDLDYLRALLDAGSTIGADRFGLYLPDMGMPGMDVRVRTLAQLCAEGYSDRIVVSHDVTCYGDWIPKRFGSSTLEDWMLTHVSDKVVPALLDAGVTREQVDQMLIGNPRRILETRDPY